MGSFGSFCRYYAKQAKMEPCGRFTLDDADRNAQVREKLTARRMETASCMVNATSEQ